MKQCSKEWYEARRGKLTASRLYRLMSDNAQTVQRLLNILRREVEAGPDGWLEGYAVDTPATAWGKEKEPEALALYAQRSGTPVREVGILFHPTLNYVGASPDGMIEGGSVEVKCPYKATIHKNTLRDGMPKRHLCQVQSQSFVTGLPFVDFISFHPFDETTRLFSEEEQLYIQRIPADPEYHRKLHTRCEWFWDILQSGKNCEGETLPY